MLIESNDLLTLRNAAHLAGLPPTHFQNHVRWGQIKPFVVIDGLSFYHRAEVLALRRFDETMNGRRPSQPLPRLQELF